MADKEDVDWGSVIQKKEDMNKLFDREKRLKSLEVRNLYKNDLDLQGVLKDHDKRIKNEEKKNDFMAVSLQKKILEREDKKRKIEKLEVQKFFASQYENQSEGIKNKKKGEYNSQIEEEKRKNQEIENQIRKEKIDKINQKKHLMKDQQDMLKHKEYQYFLKKQEEKRQKSEEIEYRSVDFYHSNEFFNSVFK